MIKGPFVSTLFCKESQFWPRNAAQGSRAKSSGVLGLGLFAIQEVQWVWGTGALEGMVFHGVFGIPEYWTFCIIALSFEATLGGDHPRRVSRPWEATQAGGEREAPALPSSFSLGNPQNQLRHEQSWDLALPRLNPLIPMLGQ